MRAFASSHPEGEIRYGKASVPSAQLAALQPKFLVGGGGVPRLYLSGCVDDKVLVYLMGSGKDAGTVAELVLVKGEQGGNEVLWQEAE